MMDQSDQSLMLDDLENDEGGFDKDIYDDNQEYRGTFNPSMEDAAYSDDHQEIIPHHSRSEDIIRQYHQDQEFRSNRNRQDLKAPSEAYTKTKSRPSSRSSSSDVRIGHRNQSESHIRTGERPGSRTSSKGSARTRSSRQGRETQSREDTKVRDELVSKLSSKDGLRSKSNKHKQGKITYYEDPERGHDSKLSSQDEPRTKSSKHKQGLVSSYENLERVRDGHNSGVSAIGSAGFENSKKKQRNTIQNTTKEITSNSTNGKYRRQTNEDFIVESESGSEDGSQISVDQSQLDGLSKAVDGMDQGMDNDRSSLNGDVVPQDQIEDHKEELIADESFEEDGETLMSSSVSDVEADGGVKIIHLDHVDYILDNIDAELSHLINKSTTKLTDDNSKSHTSLLEREIQNNQSPENSRVHRIKDRRIQKKSSGHHHHSQHITDEGTVDTGLGSGSPMEDTVENTHGKSKSSKHQLKGKKNVNGSMKVPVIEISDADSVTSEDVQIRLQETLKKHDPNHAASPSPSLHVTPSNHSNSTMTRRAALVENYSKLDSSDLDKVRDYGRQNRNENDHASYDFDTDVKRHDYQSTPGSVSRHQRADSVFRSSQIQDGVSRHNPDRVSRSSSKSEVYRSSQVQGSVSRQVEGSISRSQRSRTSTQSTQRSEKESNKSRSRSTSHDSSIQSRSRRNTNDDNDSIATEDYEQVFKSRSAQNRSSRYIYDTGHASKVMQSAKQRNTFDKFHQKSTCLPMKGNHGLFLPDEHHKQQYIDETPKKRPQRRRKHRKSNSMPGIPSGLPEYMYLRKEVGESDVGSDSIRTEDYEGLFVTSMMTSEDINPKPLTARRRQGSPKTGQMSDPESIQTEEFERHFRGLMVKQVAGVPVRNFDAVTIVSDLDSVRTTDVYQKFQDALHRGDHGQDISPHHLRPGYNVGKKARGKHRTSKKHRKLQRGERVMVDENGVSDDQSYSSLSDGDSIQTESEEYDNHGHITGGKNHSTPTNEGAKRAREKEQEKRIALAAPPPTGLRKLLTPHGSPRKTRSFPEIGSTPKGGNTPERSPAHSPPRTPTLLAPPARFKDISKLTLRQTRSFDDTRTLRTSQGQQPQFYQWSDQSFNQSLNQRQSPQWLNSRQDSVSTYEEVESLSSHRVSSTNSLNTSEAPSRLQSFGSSGSSLDRNGDYAFAWKLAGIESQDDVIPEVERISDSVSRSGSARSSSPSVSYCGSKQSERSSISDEGDLHTDIAKWVDQSRMETARKHSNAGITDVVKSNEAPEGKAESLGGKSQPVLLNMQCGDVIAGSSMEKMQFPHETDKELNLRLRNTSPAPLSGFSRTTSFDSSISSYSDLRGDIAWTPAEDVLMNLGFGGPDLGIPDRFLTSWREKVYTKRMENMRKLLRSHSSQSDPDYFAPRLNVMEKVHEEPQFGNASGTAPGHHIAPAPVMHPAPPIHQAHAPAPTPIHHSAPAPTISPVHERQLMQKKSDVTPPINQPSEPRKSPAKQITSMNSCDACTDTSDLQSVPSHPLEQNNKPPPPPSSGKPPAMHPQTSIERLHQYRRRLMKAATVSNFGKTLAEMARSRRAQPKMAPPPEGGPSGPNNAQIQQDLHKQMSMVPRKSRGSGRGRRNKYFVKQSSLPVSLETLPEEEELVKPNVRSQRSISLDTDEPILKNVPLKIVMEQPSIESREAMSRQGTYDFDIDEAIADVDEKNPEKLEKYLTVMKDIIESKDSGFENGPSRNGSPQHMSPNTVECEVRQHSVLTPKQHNSSENSRYKESQNGKQQTENVSGKENKPPEGSNQYKDDIPGTLGVNTKDCLDVQTTSSRNSSRSDESVFTEDKSYKRRSSLGSERSFGSRPSLVDMQEVFCQTIEEDDDSVFEASHVANEGEEIECICICIQTSPGLDSPPLSPLECGYGYFDQYKNTSDTADTSAKSEDSASKMSVADDGAQVLAQNTSDAGNQVSLDESESVLLDHFIKPMQNSTSVNLHKSDVKSVYKGQDKTNIASKSDLPQLSEETYVQSATQLSQSKPNVQGNKTTDISPHQFQPSAAHDEFSLPTDDDNSTREWPEMGFSPTHDAVGDDYVQDTSAEFISDTSPSDCLPESEEEQLAEKHVQLRRRRSLRPEWATPEKRERLRATRDDISTDGSEHSVSRHRRVKNPNRQESEVKSEISDDSKQDKLSDSDGRQSITSTSDVLSVFTDTKMSGTGESSPSSVYRYGPVMNTNQNVEKPSDLFRSNSDLIKRLSGPKSAQSLASPHSPLKRSLSVEAVNQYLMRPRTMSERGYRPSDIVNFNDPLGSSKHFNILRGSSSTGGLRGKMRMPMNTPETLKLASMKLERLIHKGTLRPTTFNESFQEETEEEEEEYHRDNESKFVPTDDSKMIVRDEHIRLPEHKGMEVLSASPHSFLFPSPSSERMDGDRRHTRQNSNFSDRSQGSCSSDKSLQSPGTRPPSVPSIITKGPTLDSMDSLEIVSYSGIGSEKRPPIKSLDYCAWSSQSSSSPSMLTIPSFHSPDMFDFESRPKVSSPSEIENEEESKPNKENSEHNEVESNKLMNDNFKLSVSNSFSICLPISPRKFEQLFIDTPSTIDSVSPHPYMYQADSEEGKDENGDSDKPKFYSSTHHEISHTVPLPKMHIDENGRKIPTMLHKLTTIPGTTNKNGKPFTVHLEIPPVNLQEIDTNLGDISNDKEVHKSVKVFKISPEQELGINDKESQNNWLNETYHNAPYHWDVTDPIPVFPLYRDGHVTSNISHQSYFIPRNGVLHNDDRAMPTFDEICNKAGRLIQNLERTVPVEQFLPVQPAPPDREDHGKASNGNHGMTHDVVVIKVVDHAEEADSGHGGNSERDESVIKDEQEAIEEEMIRVTHHGMEGANPTQGISKAQRNQLETPPDWGAKLESLANLEDLMETERDMRRRLNSLTQSYDDVKNKKQVAINELKTLQEAVYRNKADIHKAEDLTTQNLEKADGIRSQLVVLEYQRDQARRELRDLEENIEARQGSPIRKEESWNMDSTDQELLNMTTSQIQNIIEERDELKSRLRKGQGDLSPVERSELERQLSSTKKDLFEERKSSPTKMDQLEESGSSPINNNASMHPHIFIPPGRL